MWAAINVSKGDNSPGPDGFSMQFYKSFWSLIGHDVNVVNAFALERRNIHAINYSWLFLIQKSLLSADIDNFRPISLENCCYKIITKCVANRLKSVLDTIIDLLQTAFLSGRNILDSVAIVEEILSHLHETKQPGLLLKIDFKKSFNRIN